MKYRITHSTIYHYSQPVGLCQNEARLQPRYVAYQRCEHSHFDINPKPLDLRERTDFFGNRVAYFAIQQAHTQLVVTAISDVTVLPKPNRPEQFSAISWEQVQTWLRETPLSGSGQQAEFSPELFEARQYVLDSPMIPISPDVAQYAQASFVPNRPLVEVVHNLMGRIFNDFTYDPSFTTIATPLADVLKFRRGVCQDFAHLGIACLRAYGLAARYISGYVETLPEPGKARLVGADASHAWFSVYIPDTGWLDFDPTNNTMPLEQHITLAWGRDFADVTPLKGIAFGGGQHTLTVSVDVLRLD